MSEHDKFSTILKHNHVSITKPRLAIFRVLVDAKEPLKNGEIARLTPSIDRASVYRTLELFASLSITNTVIRGWTPLTELAGPFRAHHHHISCTECGTTENIEDGTLEDVLKLVASKKGYQLAEHSVELTGLCSSCKETSSRNP